MVRWPYTMISTTAILYWWNSTVYIEPLMLGRSANRFIVGKASELRANSLRVDVTSLWLWRYCQRTRENNIIWGLRDDELLVEPSRQILSFLEITSCFQQIDTYNSEMFAQWTRIHTKSTFHRHRLKLPCFSVCTIALKSLWWKVKYIVMTKAAIRSSKNTLCAKRLNIG